MTRGSGDRRARLGKIIRAIRQSQRLSVDAAAAKAPMSATTWQRVEDGKPVRGLTYRGIEEVLGLPRGDIDDVLAGSVPLSRLEDQPSRPRPAVFPRPRYADPALQHIWETPGLPEETRRALIALATGMRGNEREA